MIKGVVVMKRVGLIGWRGMVGSVLMQRMLEEQDFDLSNRSSSPPPMSAAKARRLAKILAPLKDAYSIDELKSLDVILTCQGGDYTNEVSLSCVKPAGKGLLD